jgi:hypothetical protein
MNNEERIGGGNLAADHDNQHLSNKQVNLANTYPETQVTLTSPATGLWIC